MRRLFCLTCIFLLCIFWIANAAEIDENQPTPTIEPQSMSTTEPEPTPTAEPAPTTEPESTPTVEPAPTTEPESTPTAEPAPTTEPKPTPTAEPIPTTEPESTPTVEPTPTMEPEPTPTTSPFLLMPMAIDTPLDAPVYDVSVSFDNGGFTYSYSGEYQDSDYSGISENWTDNTASVTVSCGTDSDPVQVYITTSSLDAAVCDAVTGAAYVNISASNSYSESSPAILSAGEDVSITYTASGTIPFDAVLSDGQGGSFSPCDLTGSTIRDISVLTISVYIDAAGE